MIEAEDELNRENRIHDFISSLKETILSTTSAKVLDELSYEIPRLKYTLRKADEACLKIFDRILKVSLTNTVLLKENTLKYKTLIKEFKGIIDENGLSQIIEENEAKKNYTKSAWINIFSVSN
jgi:hypothetical protein